MKSGGRVQSECAHLNKNGIYACRCVKCRLLSRRLTCRQHSDHRTQAAVQCMYGVTQAIQDECRGGRALAGVAVHHQMTACRQCHRGVFTQAIQRHVDCTIDAAQCIFFRHANIKNNRAVLDQACGIGRQHPMHHRRFQYGFKIFFLQAASNGRPAWCEPSRCAAHWPARHLRQRYRLREDRRRLAAHPSRYFDTDAVPSRIT